MKKYERKLKEATSVRGIARTIKTVYSNLKITKRDGEEPFLEGEILIEPTTIKDLDRIKKNIDDLTGYIYKQVSTKF